MNGIDKMTALILSEAEADRTARLEKAQTEAEALLAEYRSQADALKAAEAEKTKREAAAMLERAESSAHQAERNILLAARSELLDRVYASALEKLCGEEAAAKPAYLEMLKSVFQSVWSEQCAAEQVAAENDLYGEYQTLAAYTLVLNARDREAIGDALLAYCKKIVQKAGKKLQLSPKNADIQGGFVLICGEVELNCSLEQYMNQVRSATEGEVCSVLFA